MKPFTKQIKHFIYATCLTSMTSLESALDHVATMAKIGSKNTLLDMDVDMDTREQFSMYGTNMVVGKKCTWLVEKYE